MQKSIPLAHRNASREASRARAEVIETSIDLWIIPP